MNAVTCKYCGAGPLYWMRDRKWTFLVSEQSKGGTRHTCAEYIKQRGYETLSVTIGGAPPGTLYLILALCAQIEYNGHIRRRTMVTEITKFYADDGVAFDTRSEAVDYEFHQTAKAELRYLDYIGRSYSGTQLLKNYSLDKYGTWEVKGEDSNADFGGHHYQPSLGFFQGTLEQVIRKAVSLPSFYTWGGGGNIVYTNPPEVLSL